MVLAVTSLMIKDMKLSNLQPLLQSSPKDFIQSVHIILTIGILDVVGMLMIFPYALNNSKLRKPLLLAITFTVALILKPQSKAEDICSKHYRGIVFGLLFILNLLLGSVGILPKFIVLTLMSVKTANIAFHQGKAMSFFAIKSMV